MPVEKLLDFDPYHLWLGVTAKSPRTPYDLLRLMPLEDKEMRIRSAVERQRLALEKVQTLADPELWEQISQELEEAIATLQDPDRKAILDASLQRQGRSRAAKTNGNSSPDLTAPAGVTCRKCQRSNPSARQFCSGCGASLWEKCDQCGTEVAADERFCGSCGADVQSIVQQRGSQLEKLLQEAEDLLSEHRYDSAFTRLREVATVTDPRFDTWVQRGLTLLGNIEQRKSVAHAEARNAYEKAQQLVFRHAYERAMAVLMEVHPNLRTSEMVDLLESARSMRDELLKLSGEIREAVVNKQFTGLLPRIERLLTLKPDHPTAGKLAEDLRDRLVSQARNRIAQHRYEEAARLLDSIPRFVRTPEIDNLADQATELACQLGALQTAALVDDTTLALARRLAKAVGGNEEVQTLCREMQQKWAQRPADPRLPAVDWAPAHRRLALGMPVDWLGHFTSLSIESAAQDVLSKHPGSFFVAMGLALEGLDAAAVPIDHLPREKAGLLQSLTSFTGRRQSQTAWGLDLSASGLKAIKLGRDAKSGQFKLLAAANIAHSKPLNHPDVAAGQLDIVKATLSAFLEQHPPQKQDRLVGGLAGYRVLGRFFEIPPMPAKKVLGEVEYEARHQFPIGLDELIWGHHINDLAAKDADNLPRHVMVSAAREFQVKERLALFKHAGLELDMMQNDCQALHNAIVHEFFAGSPVPGSEALCVVDVGVDATNIVISAPRCVWFRSLRQGTHELTANMAKQFQLTYEQADLLRCEPQRARRLHQLLDLWQPFFVQLTSEVGKSLEAYQKLYPDHPIKRIYGLGGGFRTFGLLKHLRMGR